MMSAIAGKWIVHDSDSLLQTMRYYECIRHPSGGQHPFSHTFLWQGVFVLFTEVLRLILSVSHDDRAAAYSAHFAEFLFCPHIPQSVQSNTDIAHLGIGIRDKEKYLHLKLFFK